MKFIIYTSIDEVLITTKEEEKKMLKIYFKNGLGRDIEEFEREEVKTEAVRIEAGKLNVGW